MDVADVIDLLGLEPHAEGGCFAETFRAPGDGRTASTAIYYLLRAGEVSRWHRVLDADEVFHHYAGGPLELRTWSEGGPVSTTVLGDDLAAGQRPQAVIPAGVWQTARPLDGWVLLGATVAPAFVYEAWELAPEGWEPTG